MKDFRPVHGTPRPSDIETALGLAGAAGSDVPEVEELVESPGTLVQSPARVSKDFRPSSYLSSNNRGLKDFRPVMLPDGPEFDVVIVEGEPDPKADSSAADSAGILISPGQMALDFRPPEVSLVPVEKVTPPGVLIPVKPSSSKRTQAGK